MSTQLWLPGMSPYEPHPRPSMRKFLVCLKADDRAYYPMPRSFEWYGLSKDLVRKEWADKNYVVDFVRELPI